MTISVSCDSCGKQLRLRPHLAGKRIKCPGCGAVVRAPFANQVIDAEEDDRNWAEENDEWSDEFDDDRRPCPACGEMIINSAAKCRFCGEIFDPKLRKKARVGSKASDADLSVGDWVVAILCSWIGCIAGIVWMIQGKPKGIKMFLVSLAVQIVLAILQILAEVGKQQRQF